MIRRTRSFTLIFALMAIVLSEPVMAIHSATSSTSDLHRGRYFQNECMLSDEIVVFDIEQQVIVSDESVDSTSPSSKMSLRVCPCASEVIDRDSSAEGHMNAPLCPADFNQCIVTSTRGQEGAAWTHTVQCTTFSSQNSLVKICFPLATFWLVTLLFAFAVSLPGLAARQYVRQQWQRTRQLPEKQLLQTLIRFPERMAELTYVAMMREPHPSEEESDTDDDNEEVASNLANAREDDPNEEENTELHQRLNGVIHHIFGGQGLFPEDGLGAFKKREGFLRLKRWKDPSLDLEEGHIGDGNADIAGDMSHQCAICLADLQEGDVVGDIPCQHCFHRECLKVWLQKQNRCPLCNHCDLVQVS